MKADKILSMLAEKHSDDVFIPECKDGSTWYTHGLKKLDAWVMPRSWANLRFIGYEIKVSRSDFLRDTKYQEYMKLCNEFYFVTAKGVCDKSEIPAEAGLMQVSETGSRLFTKKKAAFREIDFPKDLFIYILMCRTRIKQDEYRRSVKEYWEEWLREQSENQNLGRAVSKRLAKLYKENVENAREENRKLKQQMEYYSEFKELLAEIGITDKDSYWNALNKVRDVKDRANVEDIQNALNKYSHDFNQVIDDIKSNLGILKIG